LSEATIERLARLAVHESAAPEQEIVEQGEAGESFYVVDSGAVDVFVDGARVTTLRNGDYFGEIALLRNVPRTATVRALEHTVLLVLGRTDFLPAIEGYAPGLASAEAVVGRRLATRS
jgi:CRP-like cAMP-binding protein